MRLTTKEAAARMCVSLSLVYALLKSRKLPAYRVGVRGKGKWLIEEEDLDGFLDTCKVEEPRRSDDGDLKFLK